MLSLSPLQITGTLLRLYGRQAGKDIYVEKPGSHNIWEGRKMVEAVHKYDRMLSRNYRAPYIVPENV